MNQTELNNLIKDLTLRVPQLEPFMYVCKLRVLTSEEYAKIVPPPMPQTAGCSRKEFIFNSDFIDSLPAPKQRGLILHEILHGALGHITHPFIDKTLTYSSFKLLANVAQDYVIENIVNEIGKQESPTAKIEDRQIQCNYEVDATLLKYNGWNWRQVYDELRANAKEIPPQFDQHGSPDDSDSDEDANNSERLWKAAREESERINEELKASNTKGTGDIVIEPDVAIIPWQETLASLLTSIPEKTRKSWSRVKRRPFVTRGEYQPTIAGTRDALEHVYMFIDTSGSMYDVLNTCAADIMNLLHTIEVEKLELIYYDVGIQERIVVEAEDIKNFKIHSMKGGGGTCVKLAIDEVMKSEDYVEDAVFLVLTDGYDDYRLGDVNINSLIWLSYGTAIESDCGTSIIVT